MTNRSRIVESFGNFNHRDPYFPTSAPFDAVAHFEFPINQNFSPFRITIDSTRFNSRSVQLEIKKRKNCQFPPEKGEFIQRIRFSLSESRGVQRDSGELGQVGRPAMVRDSGSKHENSRASARPPRRMAGRSGGRVSARLARNWFQPGGRDSWFHGESFVPAEGERRGNSPFPFSN